jgi:hypothetical protein
MLQFFFVRLRYFWYKWGVNKGQSTQEALFNAKLASICFFIIFILEIFVLTDILFNTRLILLIQSAIPGDTFLNRRVYTILLVLAAIGLYEWIGKRMGLIRMGKRSAIFEKYIHSELTLSFRDEFLVISMVLLIVLSPFFAAIYYTLQ